MDLGRLINELAEADQDYVAKFGFRTPHSWRGDYMQLAFEPAENVTVASMLANARSALGATFIGYKGGYFTMNEDTDCYIDGYGSYDGDKIGPVLLAYMTGRAG